MKGREWIWAVQEVNCIGLILLKLLRVVWPHLSAWPNGHLLLLSHYLLLVGPSGSTIRGQQAPPGIFGSLYTTGHRIFFPSSCWMGWVTQPEGWSPVGDEKGPNAFPSSYSPLGDIPESRAGAPAGWPAGSVYYSRASLVSTFHCFPGFPESFPLFLTLTVLGLSLQIIFT